MAFLILGLLLFLGIHSCGYLAESCRNQCVAKMGPLPWKLLYTLVSFAGLALIVWGYGQARLEPQWLWISPVWTRHLAALLTLPAFILLAAAYVPGTFIKARVGHPMLLGVKFWAIAHLLANGTLADLLLFGGFLAWAVLGFAVSRRRDRRDARVYPPVSPLRDLLALVLGLVLWAVFAMVLHKLLIGVAPFARAM
jgi:uncharacterized membrane protein